MEPSKLKIGILYHKSSKKDSYNDRFAEILNFNKINYCWMNIDDDDFWEKLKTLDLFIFRYLIFDTPKQIADIILPIIEKHYNIKVIPSQINSWHYDDKIKEYYLSMSYNLPMVPSWIFWDRKKTIEWCKTADYPIVFKLKGGASSTNVILVKSKRQAVHLINKMFTSGIKSNKLPFFNSTRYVDFKVNKWIRSIGSYIYKSILMEDATNSWKIHKNYIFFQKYLPNNDFDTRVTIIGNRAFAFMRHNRKGDFRSSGSGIIDYNPKNIDLEIIKTAFEINRKINFQSMAFDFLYNEEHKPEFCEMSYTFVDYLVKNCEGYWDEDLTWHPGHFWPQYLQLMDMLNLPDLKQPDI